MSLESRRKGWENSIFLWQGENLSSKMRGEKNHIFLWQMRKTAKNVAGVAGMSLADRITTE